MRAGSVMTGHLVIDNRSGHAIREPGCISLFAISLSSPTYHPTVVWAECLQELTIPAGHHTYRMLVQATYSQCSRSNPPPGAPKCLSNGHMPPLPAGHYRVTLVQSRDLVKIPPPIPLRVTPSGHR
jgi:hypothetical protein